MAKKTVPTGRDHQPVSDEPGNPATVDPGSGVDVGVGTDGILTVRGLRVIDQDGKERITLLADDDVENCGEIKVSSPDGSMSAYLYGMTGDDGTPMAGAYVSNTGDMAFHASTRGRGRRGGYAELGNEKGGAVDPEAQIEALEEKMAEMREELDLYRTILVGIGASASMAFVHEAVAPLVALRFT
jgi:hypothetical protein